MSREHRAVAPLEPMENVAIECPICLALAVEERLDRHVVEAHPTWRKESEGHWSREAPK